MSNFWFHFIYVILFQLFCTIYTRSFLVEMVAETRNLTVGFQQNKRWLTVPINWITLDNCIQAKPFHFLHYKWKLYLTDDRLLSSSTSGFIILS